MLRFSFALTLVAALTLTACQTEQPAPEPIEPEPLSVTFSPVDRSPGFPEATLDVTAPEEGAVLEAGPATMTGTVSGYELGIQTTTDRANEIANSADGQHIHIILNNDPYMANYTAGEPFDIGTLEPGPYSMVAFLSRSYHESVKGDGAMQVVNFYVGDETGTFPFDMDAPQIVYSRPKGTYPAAQADPLLFDFYLHNVTLSPEGYRARYTIRRADASASAQDPSITLSEWTPVYARGLTPGTYVVTLELLDADGNRVPGTFNYTEREITVE